MRPKPRPRDPPAAGEVVSYSIQWLASGLGWWRGGGKATVDGICGETLTIRIKPGTKNGALLRIPGRGMNVLDSETDRGDLYAQIEIVVPHPDEIDDDELDLYRQIADITEYWVTQVDPFWPHKREQYQSVAHAVAAQQADTASRTAAPFEALSLASVFANRIDLSHAAAHEQGVRDNQELLRTRRGPVHLVLDNAGTELTVDLFLTRNLLERLGLPVILHVKQHPAFVSDVVPSDVSWLLGTTYADASRSLWRTWGSDALSCRDYLRDAVRKDQLQVHAHEFWNGPRSLWQLPADLVSQFRAARLVIMKGDAHYRRALGDALWPLDATFPSTTAYFPAPLLALRTLKSDPVVGLCRSTIETLQGQDPTWRTNGQRGLACLGGQGC